MMLKANILWIGLSVIFTFVAVGSCQGKNRTQSLSCNGRCFAKYNDSLPCQCTKKCIAHEDCCDDYVEVCKPMYAEKCQIYRPNKEFCQTCAFTNGSSVTNKEILDFSKRLWDLNLFKPRSSDFIINKQGFTTTRNTADVAESNLFTYVNETILQRESFQKLIVMFDNYEKERGINETFTNNKKKEQNDFLNYVLSTPVGKALRKFLYIHGLSGCGRMSDFKQVLRKIWFENFSSKKGTFDISGFEHIFVGEHKRAKVSGFHNWLRYYLLEKDGDVNYYGHLDKPEDNLPSIKQQLQFYWEGHRKPISSFFVGTSPEWEFSVYTLCYLTRPDTSRCRVALEDLEGNPYEVQIQTYSFENKPRENGLRHLVTAYPL